MRIGTDMVEIARIKDPDRLANKILSPKEKEYYEKNKFPLFAFSSQAKGFFEKYDEGKLSEKAKDRYLNEKTTKNTTIIKESYIVILPPLIPIISTLHLFIQQILLQSTKKLLTTGSFLFIVRLFLRTLVPSFTSSFRKHPALCCGTELVS